MLIQGFGSEAPRVLIDGAAPMMDRPFIAVLLSAAAGAAAADNSACDFGPTHHSHLALPLANDRDACKQADAHFFLSHGATWFCPHTYDIKLLATIVEDGARETLCDSHFASVGKKGVSPKHVLRPTLPAGGLPALGRGEMASWASPVLYHVHSFGKDNQAGPDAGWNVTIIRNETSTINVVRVLYGRRLDAEPSPSALTYLVHGVGGGGADGEAVLSHYISTSGASGFDHIVKASLRHDVPGQDGTEEGALSSSSSSASQPVALRSEWPTFLTIDGRPDDVKQRLKAGGAPVAGRLHVSDASGLPATVAVRVSVTLDYYSGTSDGFAGFGTMCPTKPPAPQSPTTCFPANHNQVHDHARAGS